MYHVEWYQDWGPKRQQGHHHRKFFSGAKAKACYEKNCGGGSCKLWTKGNVRAWQLMS